MYVFGGFTSSFSSFNDLWKLNLSTKTWSRITVEGRCPIPKAGATMVTYKDKLILFGGLLPPAHGTLYQVIPVNINLRYTKVGALTVWECVDPGSHYLLISASNIHIYNSDGGRFHWGNKPTLMTTIFLSALAVYNSNGEIFQIPCITRMEKLFKISIS